MGLSDRTMRKAAGVLFGRVFKNVHMPVPKNFQIKQLPEEQLPSFGISLFTALLPVLLMAVAAIAKMNLSEEDEGI